MRKNPYENNNNNKKIFYISHFPLHCYIVRVEIHRIDVFVYNETNKLYNTTLMRLKKL